VNNLSLSEIKNIISQIETIRLLIDENNVETTPDKLNQFENKLTLAEIEYCLSIKEKVDLSERLCAVLAQRWERIRTSSMSYTESPLNIVNQFCLDLAKELYTIPKTEKEIDELPDCEGPYFILMPSLSVSTDVIGSNIHNLTLQQFILSDDEKIFIPILPILERAAISDNGEFEHYVSMNGSFLKLSDEELNRLKHHSAIIEEYVLAIEQLNEFRIKGEGLGAHLQRLVVALRAGGAHGGNDGQEYNAGSQANIGILEFSAYWDKVPAALKSDYLRQYPELNDSLGRLFRPRDTDYGSTIYCVELIAQAIDNIIQIYNLSIHSLEKLKIEVANKKEIIDREIKSDKYQLLPSKASLPKIYAAIFTLPIEEQKVIFPDYSNICMYLLENDPSSLVEIKDLITEKMQQEISTTRFLGNKTALMIAAASGSNQLVKLLLEMNVNIDAIDFNGDTALMHAVRSNNRDVVLSLLEAGARIDILNYSGLNAITLAERNNQIDLLEIIFLHAVSLNLHTQRELLPIDCGHNVIFSYVVERHFNLCPKILRKIIELNDKVYFDGIIHLVTIEGVKDFMTALMIAAVENQVDLVQSLVENMGIDINERYLNGDNKTALMLAAFYGKIDVVNKLLSLGAKIELKSSQNNTALNLAISRGHSEVVEVLLAHGASLLTRNNNQDNALDIALKFRPELIDMLLLKAISLDEVGQQELLKYILPPIEDKTVFNYIFHHRRYLINSFIENAIANNNQSVLDAKYQNTMTILMIAVLYGNNDTVCRLIDECHLNIDEQDNFNNTALIYAAGAGLVDIVLSLLSRNANIALKNSLGNTALISAVENGHLTVLRAFLEKNPILTTRNHMEQNLLDIAIIFHPECIEAILLQAANLSLEEQTNLLSKIDGGRHKTVLSYAACHQVNCVEQILTKTIDLKKHDVLREKIWISESHEMQLVPYIIQNRKARECSLVLRLIDEGIVDINQQDVNGNTILNLAIENYKINVINALLEKGIKITTRNLLGQNALDLAFRNVFAFDEILLAGTRLETSMQKELLAKFGIFKDIFSYAFLNRPYLLMPVFKQIQPDNEKLEAYIKKINLLEHIEIIKLKWQEMVVKSRSNPKYIEAARVAGELTRNLMSETYLLLKHDANLEGNDKKIAKFQSKCLLHIEKAKPILEEHRGDLWKRILRSLIIALTFPISLTMYALGFFSLKTDSAIKLNGFEKDLRPAVSV